MQEEAEQIEGGFVSKRTAEVAVALLFLVAAAIVIGDSLRLGAGWGSDGPESGYFPFYIALAMAGASLVNLYRALQRSGEAAVPFVSTAALRRVAWVLVPLLVYVGAVGSIGIYIASMVYIGAFMRYFGRYPLWKGLATGAGISLALFLMFERWFLVPLPKGPLETWLGY